MFRLIQWFDTKAATAAAAVTAVAAATLVGGRDQVSCWRCAATSGASVFKSAGRFDNERQHGGRKRTFLKGSIPV